MKDKHFLFLFFIVWFLPALVFATLGYAAYGLYLVTRMILTREMPRL